MEVMNIWMMRMMIHYTMKEDLKRNIYLTL